MKSKVHCNWLLFPKFDLCGKPVAGMIHGAGYCQEHLPKAEAMYGMAKQVPSPPKPFGLRKYE